ncbi:protein maelstrom homolog [Toxorhynchites rutilus septentrionalis]|uniref:protein maelstrom homolog n=1 Tax=Toxorhynchites rutilus septentrionalis TaxID=329112 RepID=UPI0024791202|nr:protein maelstrom homolog [Toxorhynchites rutilus septentrionalis]
MPPKKSQKSTTKGPFFFFMREFKSKQEAAGHHFKGGMIEVMEKAGPHWDKLAPYEREPYNLMAKKYKANPKDLVGERFTTQGIPFSTVDNDALKRRQKDKEIQTNITKMINSAVSANALEDLELFFISCNYFCVTTANNFVPAELGIVKYSLANGIIDKMNIPINPLEIPLGMAHDAELHTSETHQLPLPPDCEGEDDYEKILKEIFKFTGYSFSKGGLPPFFTMNKEMTTVENIMLTFLETTEIEVASVKIYPLIDLFFLLKRATENYGLDISTFPSVHMAKGILEKDIYAYTNGIGCEYHETLGNPITCTLSKCTRWAYTISDSCCLDLGIEMEKGRHLPENMTMLTDVTETLSCISMRLSKTTLNSDVTQHSAQSCQNVSKVEADNEQGNSAIYSSRIGTKAKPSKNEKGFNETNPFHNDKYKMEAKTKPNPWSRKTKLIESRVPQEVETTVIGRGRGTLAKVSVGRGMGLNVTPFLKLRAGQLNNE